MTFGSSGDLGLGDGGFPAFKTRGDSFPGNLVGMCTVRPLYLCLPRGDFAVTVVGKEGGAARSRPSPDVKRARVDSSKAALYAVLLVALTFGHSLKLATSCPTRLCAVVVLAVVVVADAGLLAGWAL